MMAAVAAMAVSAEAATAYTTYTFSHTGNIYVAAGSDQVASYAELYYIFVDNTAAYNDQVSEFKKCSTLEELLNTYDNVASGTFSDGEYHDTLGKIPYDTKYANKRMYLAAAVHESGEEGGVYFYTSYEPSASYQNQTVDWVKTKTGAGGWAPMAVPIPEPTSGLLLLLGVAGLALKRKRA